MNWAWWDGKMSAHHYHEEHGLDRATLQDTTLSEISDGSLDVVEEESDSAEVKHGQ